MFGAQMFGQEMYASVADFTPPAQSTGGGGWQHRKPVKLPERKKPEFKPPVFKKPNPYRW